MPSVFSDHMVLQQQDDVKIWGWASPHEKITIAPSWTNETYKTEASNLASWQIKIKTPKYGGPYTISIKGYNEVVLKDVLIGEVWLCSGQSNMEMSASWGIDNGEEEIAKANYDNIRFFTSPKMAANSEQNNIISSWEICTSESMKYASSAAYFFAKKLQQTMKDVPVGLMVSAWGGTPIEIWTPENIIKKDTVLLNAANKLTPVSYGPIKPGKAFNTMINPLIGYKIAGALWYQGESNVGSDVYDENLAALITSWRKLWGYNFPFYFVQIAPYNYGENHFGGVIIRDAQRKAANQIKNSGMVVISDVSPIDDIHPKDKKAVGFRLANLALKNHYHLINDLVESPSVSELHLDKNKAVISFNHADGLYANSKKSMFEISGDDYVFYPAKMKIKNNTIIISSKKVKYPKSIRFAWGNNVQSNLFNKANLPLSSFIIEK
ncbi:sialate O-acetylesterase [Wenyingzhuangia sp. chi5]|uniref:Sialate O-acetylesterase n=2 Tax=Wenyingzhuangia gilva TaxID=3057677 RepID=A0ABT8VTS1_9FLAO|nr:sialate O-acetylesterase [Wenyingzhuangia sp. chi5]